MLDAALALRFEDFKSFGLIAGGNYSVGNLTLDELGRCDVANIGESNPISERAHTVGSSCTGIGAGERGAVKVFDIVNEASLFELFRKLYSDGRRGWADVLK